MIKVCLLVLATSLLCGQVEAMKGNDARPKDAPWAVSILSDKGGEFPHICNGILINNFQQVLSTYDCLKPNRSSAFHAVAGVREYQLLKNTHANARGLDTPVLHDCPQFGLAMADLKSKFSKAPGIDVSNMRKKNIEAFPLGKEGKVYSWGTAQDTGAQQAHNFKVVKVKTVQCGVQKKYEETPSFFNICVEPVHASSSFFCWDDAGAPLVIDGHVVGLMVQPIAENAKDKCAQINMIAFIDLTKHWCWYKDNKKIKIPCQADNPAKLAEQTEYLAKGCKGCTFTPSFIMSIVLPIGAILKINRTRI